MRELLHAELEGTEPHRHGSAEDKPLPSPVPHAIDAARVHDALKGWTTSLN